MSLGQLGTIPESRGDTVMGTQQENVVAKDKAKALRFGMGQE